ncbi:MAG: threonine/homoserine/homoserine lactone efflux protein [Cocleimonas sp.]|jgi:threonine/homoserine/homoserine lactone efflux protein
MIDFDVLSKVIIFWVIFYITPGPVWVAVMEATRKLQTADIWRFFITVFFPVNITIQFVQAIVCVVFVKFVSTFFSQIGLLFYLLGGLYILYLAYKAFKSKQSNSAFELTYINLAVIMLLSPKIWLLFPSGAVIANQLSESIITNSLIFGISMLIISSLMFVLYAIIGKVGTKLLADNFSYLASGLLLFFAVFLFNEAFSIAFANS